MGNQIGIIINHTLPSGIVIGESENSLLGSFASPYLMHTGYEEVKHLQHVDFSIQFIDVLIVENF